MAGCKSCQRGGADTDPMAAPPANMGSAPAAPEGMGSPAPGPELEGSPVGSPAMAGGMSCGKKHKKGGNLTTHAVPVLLTLAATRKGKSLKNRLTLGMLKGGKKSRKSKGKGKGKKTKARKVKKSGKKSRKYRR